MYRTTDLAEIVSNPSAITRKYLNIWINGNGSYGKALSLLGWPVNAVNKPLLVWDEKNGLRVDIKAEEEVMYRKTMFRYKKGDDGYSLGMDIKALSPFSLFFTIQSIWSQSKLLVSPQNTYHRARSFVEDIPLHPPDDLSKIETQLKDLVWPRIIAVDYIGEYIISIITNSLSPQKKLEVLQTIQTKARKLDWYTQAMLAWSNYQDGKLSQQELLQIYGYAAGDDYELTRPRNYERLKKSMPEVGTLDVENMHIKTQENLAVGMHYLRSEVKRRSLIWIAYLRENLKKKNIL